MPIHFDGPENQVLALDTMVKLTRATNSFLSRLAHHGSYSDLTETQFGTLESLYHLGPMSQTAICNKLLKSGGNTTLVVDNLERLGFVRRERDKRDRRVVVVDLTPEGRTLIETIFPAHATAVTEEMSVLTPEEQRQLGDLCKKLGRGRCNNGA